MKLLKHILIFAAALLLLIAGTVILIDPFYHYHKPIGPLKAVLTEKEYQCIGSLRHFDYDAVIVGSSVSENFNNRWFDEAFDCKSIKAIRSYGATADLCFFLDEAFKSQDIRYVFYNLDPSSLKSDPHTTFKETGCPMYLYDANPFNDVEYLFNKDVLFERIPYMLAKSVLEDYDEGTSYNWGQWKEFNLDMCTGLYLRHPKVAPMNDEHTYDDLLESNMDLIVSQIKAHPDTRFYIYFPPYSMLWWDNTYREGDTQFYLYAFEKCMDKLTDYDNVSCYFFLNDRDIVLNLDENYMDTLHFSPQINRLICDCLADADDKHRVNKEDIMPMISDMRGLAAEITDELIKPYIPMIKEQIEETD